jgi:hypothetical protein
LKQQQFSDLIRAGKTQEALLFAQEELAPHGEQNVTQYILCSWRLFIDLDIQPDILEELEQTMALLAFDVGAPSPIACLLDPSQRQKTASELNSAILAAQCQTQGDRKGHSYFESNLILYAFRAQASFTIKSSYVGTDAA